MKSPFLFAVLLVLSASIVWAADDAAAGTALGALPKEAREQVLWLHKGMTRAEVEKKFNMDGGLIFVPTYRYFVRNVAVGSKVVMIDLTFQPAGMPDDVFNDPDLRNKWVRTHSEYRSWDSPKDILRNIGVAYLSGVAID